jgi:hypothetical protein
MKWFCKLNSRISPAKVAKVESEINNRGTDRLAAVYKSLITKKRSFRRVAETSTRVACAPPTTSSRRSGIPPS